MHVNYVNMNIDNNNKEPIEFQKSVTTTVVPLITNGIFDSAIEEEKFNASDLPIIATREMVIFPGMISPVPIGRMKSKLVLEKAENEHCYIGIFQQKNETETPGFKDLYKVGTLAEVIRVIDMPDGTKSALIQGRRILSLNSLTQEEPYLAGKASMLEEKHCSSKNKNFKALVSNIKDDLKVISRCSDNQLPPEVLFAMSNIDDYSFMITFLSSNFPMSQW